MQLLRDTPRVPADAQSSQTIYTTERERLTADRQMANGPQRRDVLTRPACGASRTNRPGPLVSKDLAR